MSTYPRVNDTRTLMENIVYNGGEGERLALVDAIGEILRLLPTEVIFKGSILKEDQRKEGENCG